MTSSSPLATLGIEQLMATCAPARPVADDPARTTSFADELEAVRTEATAREEAEAQAQVPAIAKLIMLLELLGLPVPASMIATLRKAGLTGWANQLEARNRRIEQEQREGRPRRAAAA